MHEKNKELANLRPAVKSTLRTADPFLENKLYYPFSVSVTPPTPPPPFQPSGPTKPVVLAAGHINEAKNAQIRCITQRLKSLLFSHHLQIGF